MRRESQLSTASGETSLHVVGACVWAGMWGRAEGSWRTVAA